MKAESSALRDFTVERRVWLLCAIALIIGIGASLLAEVLLTLIALSTNVFYYHRFSTAAVSPAGSPLGYWMVLVPVVGGLIVGLMARFGSDKIRGHGIPEAIEAILLHRARVEPKIAILKPISAAIAIGSGGPFGAEGPIIMTGGAFGSLIAQWIKLTDAERTTLSGGRSGGGHVCYICNTGSGNSACGGTFVVRIAAAKSGAGGDRQCHRRSFARVPSRPRPTVSDAGDWDPSTLNRCRCLTFRRSAWSCRCSHEPDDVCVRGYVRAPAPALDVVACRGRARDWYRRSYFPRGLGVGYDNIAELLRGNAPLALIFGILLVKSIMWAFSLGSGTSGGVLAPLLMIGGAAGALAAHVGHAPAEMQALWALIGMGAMLAGSLGVPMTAILFSLEVTHCLPALLPLTLACVGSYLVTALLMPRSILTEKLSRRGYHLTREYGIDPLEIVIVNDLMSPSADHGLFFVSTRHLRIFRRHVPQCCGTDGDGRSLRSPGDGSRDKESGRSHYAPGFVEGASQGDGERK